jgi:tetratricopeptide (TPR) repeat protein
LLPIAEFSDADRAREAYALALEAYFPRGDLIDAVAQLEKACAMESAEGLYWSVLGFCRLKLRKLELAEQAMRRALDMNDTRPRMSQYRLFFARILDLRGARAEALEEYAKIRDEPSVGNQARRGLRKPWTWRETDRFVIDFTLGDAIEPS